MTSTEPFRPWAALLPVLLVTGVGVLLAWALWSLPPEAAGLSAQVREQLPNSGVRAEVTAVLLNFRGYDTLLETAVLLTALLGVWNLGKSSLPGTDLTPGPVLETLVRFLVPVMILVTGYVLWLGGHASGGAFQAGALLAGAGVLALVIHPEAILLRDHLGLRTLLVLGPLMFSLVAGLVMLTGRLPLEYPPAQAGSLILLIEAANTLSIGLMLTLLFAGGRPPRGRRG